MDGGSDDDLARKAVISFDFDDYDSIEQDGVISVKELVSKLLTQWERYVTAGFSLSLLASVCLQWLLLLPTWLPAWWRSDIKLLFMGP